MKDIVVGIDFSECSINALEHAVTIAQKLKSDIAMVHVFNPGSTHKTIYKYADPVDEATKLLEEIATRYQPLLTQGTISYRIREGRIYKEVAAEANERKAIYVFVGTHGASGFEELWAGSNAYKIISYSKCPVITLREGVKADRNLERIIVPIDANMASRQKVPYAANMAKLFNAEVHVLALYHTTVKDVQNQVLDYAKQACEFFEKHEINFLLKSIRTKNVTDSTIEYAKKVDANLIVIMTEQVSSPANLILGNYALQMISRSPMPVMTVQPKELMRVLSR